MQKFKELTSAYNKLQDKHRKKKITMDKQLEQMTKNYEVSK